MQLREETRFVWLVIWAAASVSLSSLWSGPRAAVECAPEETSIEQVRGEQQANKTNTRRGGQPIESANATTTTRAAPNKRRLEERGRADEARDASWAHYKLPTWFNFEAYKSLYGKLYASGPIEELHKRIYLRTSLRVFEQRAQFRARRRDSLASVNELSDLTGEQLAAFKGQLAVNTSEPERVEGLPECCSYDQVYGKIIELLERATSSHDVELSRALVAELMQKPLLVNQIGVDGRALATNELGLAQRRLQWAGTDELRGARRARAKLEMPAAAATNATKSHSARITSARLAAGGQLANAAPRPERQPLDWTGRKRLEGAVGARSNLLEASGDGAARDAKSAGRLEEAAAGKLERAEMAAEARSGGVPALGGGAGPISAASEQQLRRYVDELAGPNSTLGRLLTKHWSAYYGEPVEVRARLVSSSPWVSGSQSGNSTPATTSTSRPSASKAPRATTKTI